MTYIVSSLVYLGRESVKKTVILAELLVRSVADIVALVWKGEDSVRLSWVKTDPNHGLSPKPL